MYLWIKDSQTKMFDLKVKVEYKIGYKYQKILHMKLNLY